MKFTRILLLALTLLFAACAKEHILDGEIDTGAEGLIPLNIDGSISQVHTKATASGFVDKDALGLFAVNYTANNTVPGVLEPTGNQADNVKYIFDESGHKWNPVKPVYYKDVNTNVDLYVYYPYFQGITDVSTYGFEVQKDQSTAATDGKLSGYEASDWMWGKAAEVTPTESRIAVTLKHKLSAVQVSLNEGTGFATDEFAALEKSVIVTNTTRKATLNFATGAVAAVGEPQADGIVMCPQADGSFRAIVVPQTVTANTKLFAITVNGISYNFKQGADVSYQAGKQMVVNININKKTPTGDYELTLGGFTITEWKEDLNSHGGEARQYYVVNVETPGTLGALIAAAGKNPDKIRNLKVSGNVNRDDFNFMCSNMEILEAVNMKEAILVKDDHRFYCNTYDACYPIYVNLFGEPDDISVSYEAHWNRELSGVIPAGAFYNKSSLTYFSFPEDVSIIGEQAFIGTKLAGALVIPDGVQVVGTCAFYGTLVTSVSFPMGLRLVGHGAFNGCHSLSGSLLLPNALTYIGPCAFESCNFSGYLSLPDDLTYIGYQAFGDAGNFTGDLVIPSGIKKLEASVFCYSKFTGKLVFDGEVTSIGENAFQYCGLSGELVIPEGIATIPDNSFSDNNFSSIILPSTVKQINGGAFSRNNWLENISFPEGLLVIGRSAFNSCGNLLSLDLPSSLQTIQSYAFEGCYYISSIKCKAIEPPTVMTDAFRGVGKDNFAIEVPEQSIIRYQTESGWSDFKRITAHYDFSIGRTKLRLLNKGESRTYTLRCPSGFDWNIDSKPDWVTVSPSSGTGKTDVTITVSDMARTSETFEVFNGNYEYPLYSNYAGRSGDIIFKLIDKNYSCKVTVEQFDYDYADGQSITLQSASKGNGIDIVFVGEGFDAQDIASGILVSNSVSATDYFFDIEPYKTYKDYFNVYVVISKSEERGIGDVDTIIENKFPTPDDCLIWAQNARSGIDISKSVVIMLQNSTQYYGWTYMYLDGSAISVVPLSQQPYPRDFRGLIQHEAGGHAFGKLGDEYIYHNAFITECNCCDNCDHPLSEYYLCSQYGKFKRQGWFKNLSMFSDHNRVPWAHLIYNPDYSNKVDMYEGAYMHSRGMYRSEVTSCMNNNIPYFNSISRQAIVERIKDYAGETFTLEDFYANDSFTVGTKAPSPDFDWTFGVDPNVSIGPEHGSIIFMGDKPNLKK